MATADFKQFYFGLCDSKRKEFARDAKTTTGYIETHLVYARRMPRRKRLTYLIDACEKHGGPNRARLINFFMGGTRLVRETKRAAA